jgi:murein DD-endopeptidase
MTRRVPAASTLRALWFLLALLIGCSSSPPHPPTDVAAKAARLALDMKGRPYRYGGNTPEGFDCSGLVQYSYARLGVRLARTTEAQWQNSRAISLTQLHAGDLLFFDQDGKRHSHVGVYLGADQFVHAPSSGKRVSVAHLSDPYWRRHLHGARRVVTD